MCSTSAEPKKSKKSKKGHKFAPEDGMDKGFGYVQEDGIFCCLNYLKNNFYRFY